MSRNIRLAQWIYFCTRFHLYIHIYALVLQSRGLTLAGISLLESIVIGTLFVMEVPTGIIADKIGRKWSVTAALVLLMGGETLFLFSRTLPILLIFTTICTGTGFAFMSGAMEALIYDSLPEANREQTMQQVMGRYHSLGQIAFFLSPVVGALILGGLSPERVDMAIGLTVLALAVGVGLCLFLREPAAPWRSGHVGMLTIIRRSAGEVRRLPQLRRFILFCLLTSTFTGTLITTLAAPHLTRNQVDPAWIALALSLGSLLAAFTQRHAYRVERWLGFRRAMLLLSFIPGIAYLLLAIITGSTAWLVIVWLYGTNDMRAPLVSAYHNTLIASENRATTLSLISMFNSLFIAIAAPLYAALATYSLPLAFGVMGGMIMLATLVLQPEKAEA
jgi:MFS family permease